MVDRKVVVDHLSDRLNHRFSHFLLHEFEHFALISCPHDQAKEDEHRQNVTCKVYPRQNHLAESENCLEQVQYRRLNSPAENKVLNASRREFHDTNDYNSSQDEHSEPKPSICVEWQKELLERCVWFTWWDEKASGRGQKQRTQKDVGFVDLQAVISGRLEDYFMIQVRV